MEVASTVHPLKGPCTAMTVMTGPALNGYSHKLHDVFFVLMLFKHWFPGILLVVSMYASK